MLGAFLSTLTPVMGPAVAVLPTASVRVLVPVWALLFSLPSATLVDKEKFASLVGLRPEPPSEAVQLKVWLVACQSLSAVGQEKLGAFLSTLTPVMAGAVTVLPATSVRVLVPVEALLVSLPAATVVDREKLESLAGVRPEPPSEAVQLKVWLVACQSLSAVGHEKLGAFLSTLTPVMAGAVTVLPATSVRVLVPVEA